MVFGGAYYTWVGGVIVIMYIVVMLCMYIIVGDDAKTDASQSQDSQWQLPVKARTICKGLRGNGAKN